MNNLTPYHTFTKPRPDVSYDDISGIVYKCLSEQDNIGIEVKILADLFADKKSIEYIMTRVIRYHYIDYDDDLEILLSDIESLILSRYRYLVKGWVSEVITKDLLLKEGTDVIAKHGREYVTGKIHRTESYENYFQQGKYLIELPKLPSNNKHVGYPVVNFEDVYLI